MATLRRLLFVACAVGGVHVAGAGPSSAQAQSEQAVPEGAQVFQKNCVACHTMGEGDQIGPDLKGVADRRAPTWIARWIDRPRPMVEAGDSLAVRLDEQYDGDMVSLGLSSEDIAALMGYFGYSDAAIQEGVNALETESVAEGGETKEVPIEEANVSMGRRLFTGDRSFANGGARCQACHSYAGLPALGGGTLGPDLTTSYDNLGRAVVSWPQSQPPMRSIYNQKPLTEEEKAHLLAFLKTGQGRAPTRIWRLLAYAVGGAGLLFGLMAFVWSDRLRGVRRPMLRES